MTDRLAELVRQRALVQEHLAWLDRKIADANKESAAPAAESSRSPASAPSLPALPPLPNIGAPASGASASTARKSGEGAEDAKEILDQFRVAPDTVKSDVRKGCFLYFVAAFVLLGLVVTVIYFIFRRP